MQGYVLSVRPLTGESTIMTEGGEVFRCHRPDIAAALYGGDVVRFDPPVEGPYLDGVQLIAEGSAAAALDRERLSRFAAMLHRTPLQA